MYAEPPVPGMVNAMTVDVEDYFQVSAFEPYIDRGDWENLPCRVERNTDRVLEIFAECRVSATFFTLGWIAERYPGLVRRIVDCGHELACHGYGHVRVTEQTPREFATDAGRSKDLLEDLSGRAVLGYRAASYSIGAGNLWALRVLDELGFRYSSSIYPIRHDLYGMPKAPRFAFRPFGPDRLMEIPIATVACGAGNIPCGGGGYFRLLPYRFSRWAIGRVNRREGRPCVFYFHPWEIDPEQPRPVGVDPKTRFRHYLNLSRTERRLRRLLRDFRWDRMEKVYLSSGGG
jgi:polysaccharide deacetylase family protein (PEP-CTERM system associated)